MSDEVRLPAAAAPEAALPAEAMPPLIEAIRQVLRSNAEALERLAAAQTLQNDRLEALEREIRLATPVTARQVDYLNDAIRARARALLERRGLADDRRAVTRLGNAIRRAVLARYGAAALREIPRHEYAVALAQIEMWTNALTVMDIAKEARARAEGAE